MASCPTYNYPMLYTEVLVSDKTQNGTLFRISNFFAMMPIWPLYFHIVLHCSLFTTLSLNSFMSVKLREMF